MSKEVLTLSKCLKYSQCLQKCRGYMAKAIADKIDLGMIMLQVSQDDRDALKDIIQSMGIEMPDIKISVYKNRRGRYKDILLWCNSNRGICRINPVFATTYNYELVRIEDLEIKVTPRIEASAF